VSYLLHRNRAEHSSVLGYDVKAPIFRMVITSNGRKVPHPTSSLNMMNAQSYRNCNALN